MKAPQRRSRSALAVAIAAVALSGIAVGTAQAATGGGEQPVTKVRVNVSAQHFAVHGDRVIASGPVVAKAIRPDGTTKTVHKQVRLQVTASGKCRILTLHLAPLFLNLLGLEVRTSDINLTIKGDPNGGILGQLLCNLSQGITLNRQALARHSARSINKRLENRPLRVLGFQAPLRPQQQAASSGTMPTMRNLAIPVPPGECEVLDLTLGPLRLDLLGLIVNLYGETKADPVEVLITGNPNGGILGQLVCGLAGPPAA
jgi:hypothetical protein